MIATLFPVGLLPLFVLVVRASLALSYYLIKPVIERRLNQLGHLFGGKLPSAKTGRDRRLRRRELACGPGF